MNNKFINPKVKFKAHDTLNDNPINVYQILIAADGSIMGIRDLDGELYGTHQLEIELTLNS